MHPSIDELDMPIEAAIAGASFIEPRRGHIGASCDSGWARPEPFRKSAASSIDTLTRTNDSARQKLEEQIELKAHRTRVVNAVVKGHPHLDHAGSLGNFIQHGCVHIAKESCLGHIHPPT